MKLLLIELIIMSSILAQAKAIKISTISNIDFGTGVPGDASKTVIPGTSETSVNGSFQITGDSNRAYTIVLPTSASITTGSGANSDSIAISNFTSFPSGNGLLDATGSQMMYLGATRAALKSNQKSGSYSGSYSITVVY